MWSSVTERLIGTAGSGLSGMGSASGDLDAVCVWPKAA